jgi:hypothetical protein
MSVLATPSVVSYTTPATHSSTTRRVSKAIDSEERRPTVALHDSDELKGEETGGKLSLPAVLCCVMRRTLSTSVKPMGRIFAIFDEDGGEVKAKQEEGTGRRRGGEDGRASYASNTGGAHTTTKATAKATATMHELTMCNNAG